MLYFHSSESAFCHRQRKGFLWKAFRKAPNSCDPVFPFSPALHLLLIPRKSQNLTRTSETKSDPNLGEKSFPNLGDKIWPEPRRQNLTRTSETKSIPNLGDVGFVADPVDDELRRPEDDEDDPGRDPALEAMPWLGRRWMDSN
jgi:hypothetical protein